MPNDYAPAARARLLAELVARRAAGETFRAIAATPGWPSRPTLRKWLRQAPALAVARLRRPSVRWSLDLAFEICDLFDTYSLRQICARPDMPDRRTLHAWRRRHPWFDEFLETVRREARQPATGRRSTYCPMIADDVCEAILDKGSIGAVCNGVDHPHARTVRDWARAHPDFAAKLAAAYWIAHEIRISPILDDMHRTLAAWRSEDAARTPGEARAKGETVGAPSSPRRASAVGEAG